jgi:protease-4
MARTRDVVVGVIIAFFFFAFIGLMAIGMLEMYSGDSGLLAFGDRIAIVDVFGTLVSSDDIVRQIKKYGDDNSVAAILLHVDSPGGGVAVTQEIYDEIVRVRMEKDKPVIVSMTTVGASGGYYLSCAADYIVANPGTLIGSIGVIVQYPVIDELLDKVGVDYETVKTGEVKDFGSPFREPTDRDRRMMQAAIDDVYEQFVQAVMEGRNLTREEVLELADGSVFTGRQALNLGLVDELGSFQEAIRITARMVEIEGEPKTVKERPSRRLTIWDFLGGSLAKAMDAVYPSLGPELKYLYR